MDLAAVNPDTEVQPCWDERCQLACAFRWAARLNFHDSVANHFSLAVSEDSSQF